MKTLLLFPALYASEGGIERILRLYWQAVSEQSSPDEKFTVAVLNDSIDQLTASANPLRSRPDKLIAGNRRKLSFALRVLSASLSHDRVICGHVNLLPLVTQLSFLNPRCQIHLIAHGIEVWSPLSARLHRAVQHCQSIICVSDYTRRQMLSNHPELGAEKFVVIPNTLAPDFSQSTPRTPLSSPSPDHPIILTVSRLNYSDRYKGIDHLIEAMAHVRAQIPHATLRIVGRGDDRERLEKLAANVAPESIQFLGYLPDEKLREELAHCHVFALPSGGEGFGIVYLEAMIYGKPCIGAMAGGAPEVIDERSGLLVPFGDVAQLAQACVVALKKNWDSEGIKTRADNFSYGRFSQRIAKHFE